MSSVRSASRVGPNRMTTLTGVIMPTELPASRRSRSAALITLRSAFSVRLKCTYHWYLVRSFRMPGCGLGMTVPLRGSGWFDAAVKLQVTASEMQGEEPFSTPVVRASEQGRRLLPPGLRQRRERRDEPGDAGVELPRQDERVGVVRGVDEHGRAASFREPTGHDRQPRRPAGGGDRGVVAADVADDRPVGDRVGPA